MTEEWVLKEYQPLAHVIACRFYRGKIHSRVIAISDLPAGWKYGDHMTPYMDDCCELRWKKVKTGRRQ